MGSFLKQLGLILLIATLIYSGSLIIIRLKMTQKGYAFEQLKEYERALKEEQLRLKAKLAGALSPARFKVEGFKEPEPHQIIRIP